MVVHGGEDCVGGDDDEDDDGGGNGDDGDGDDDVSIGGNVNRFEGRPSTPTTRVIFGITSPARITTTR